MSSGAVNIGNKANIFIHAIDLIKCGPGVNIDSGGRLSLICDSNTSIDGCKVKSGGNVSIKGDSVILSNGFYVAKGAHLTINNN